MLILNRKVGQSIIIGDNVKVMVTRIDYDKRGEPVVVLGCDAPNDILIDRKEIRERRINKVDRLFNGNNK